jgi:hypothetical protein
MKMHIPDFSIVPLSILSDPDITFRELKVYTAIKSFMNKQTGECYPSRSTLAAITGLPESRISVVTDLLEQHGWLKKAGNGGRSRPCNYTVFCSKKTVTKTVTVTETDTVTNLVTVTEMETVTDLDVNGYQFGTETVTEPVTGNEQTKEQTMEQKKNAPVALDGFFAEPIPVQTSIIPEAPKPAKVKKAKRDYTPEFEELWGIYPPNENGIKPKKKEAFGCFNARLNEGVSLDLLKTCTTNYRAAFDSGRVKRDFVMHPTTFFGTNERYTEYQALTITTPRNTSRRIEPSPASAFVHNPTCEKYGQTSLKNRTPVNQSLEICENAA